MSSGQGNLSWGLFRDSPWFWTLRKHVVSSQTSVFYDSTYQ